MPDCDHCRVKNVVVDADGCCQNCGRHLPPFRDEPTVLLAAQAYMEAYRAVLALKRNTRCTRERFNGSEWPCYRIGLDAEDSCANCNARNDAGNQDEYKAAVRAQRNAKRKLHRALGIYA